MHYVKLNRPTFLSESHDDTKRVSVSVKKLAVPMQETPSVPRRLGSFAASQRWSKAASGQGFVVMCCRGGTKEERCSQRPAPSSPAQLLRTPACGFFMPPVRLLTGPPFPAAFSVPQHRCDAGGAGQPQLFPRGCKTPWLCCDHALGTSLCCSDPRLSADHRHAPDSAQGGAGPSRAHL